MGVEVPEEGAGGEDVCVGGIKERVKGVEFGPDPKGVFVVVVESSAGEGVFGGVGGSRGEVMGVELFGGTRGARAQDGLGGGGEEGVDGVGESVEVGLEWKKVENV